MNMTTTTVGEFLSWLVAYQSPAQLWRLNPSYLLQEINGLACSFLLLCHALRSGGRYKWLWLTTIMHGLNVEMTSYYLPDIDNFWQGQTVIMFLGKRLPIYIFLGLYAFFIYTASMIVERLRLPVWSRPFAIGLVVVTLDIPYDMLGIKLLWWTWHDTDPHIRDRMYWVPWTSYYFHATFAASFTILFRGVHHLLRRVSADGVWVEVVTAVVTALFSFPMGAVQFIILYHTLHDGYGIHSEVCVLTLFAIYLSIAWCGLLSHSSQRERTSPGNLYPDGTPLWRRFGLVPLALVIHYAFYVYTVFTAVPEEIVSVGLHEVIGDCDQHVAVTDYSLLGQHNNSKRAYLCASDYDEGIFSLRCGGQYAPSGVGWYNICGTEWGNHMEYITIICTVCISMTIIYLRVLLTYTQPTVADMGKTGATGKRMVKKVQ